MLQQLSQSLFYSPGAQAVISMSEGSADLFSTKLEPVVISENLKVSPWGADNDLPQQIIEKVADNDIVSPNILFNIQTGYAQGIKPMIKVVEAGKVVGYKECLNEEVLNFFEDNDIDGYFLEQLSDMVTFFNVFPEIILSIDGKKITGLRHLEAVYSRWASMRPTEREITRHVYAEWESGRPKNNEMTITPVLSRYNTVASLSELMVSGNKSRRFVLQVSMPTPGRTYYSQPYWWSIFKSGWYDLSKMLPAFKKVILKNHLSVRYIVYISDEYWRELYKQEGAAGNILKEKEARDKAVTAIMEFLGNEAGKGGGMISTKKNIPLGNKAFEDKYIQIETIKSPIEGGEFIEDAEEASNIISYAMGVHPNLNGATPGKSKGSLGGSDKRELFNIKQAMMRPFRDRLLKSLNLVKRYNGWPKDLVFVIPEHEFTTLDAQKSGKTLKIEE